MLGCKVVRLSDCKVVRFFLGCKAVRPQSCHITRLSGCQVVRL